MWDEPADLETSATHSGATTKAIHRNGHALSQNRNRRSKPNGSPKPRLKPQSEVPQSISQGDGEITIFLSYARADEAVYDMIRPFKKMLSHFIYAKSGRKIRTFLDQESIGWGEIWRDRLEAEILGASVFIPLLSAYYLDSEMCRMEFNRFQANATALGVKELLLPVLLLNAPAIFNEYSTDDVVQEASRRQWEVIEAAILSDPKSAAWKTTMARLADRFVESFEAAEEKLGALVESDFDSPANEDGIGGDEAATEDDPDDDGPGLAELMASLDIGIGELTAVSVDMAPAIEALGNAATAAGPLPDNPTTQQVQTWSLTTARAFEEPSSRLSEQGERMFNATKAVDLDVQRLRGIATSVLTEAPGVASNYNEMIQQLTGLDTVREQLHSLLDQMKPAEAFSVPLRRALRPARRGVTRVTDSIRLIETWRLIDLPTDL